MGEGLANDVGLSISSLLLAVVPIRFFLRHANNWWSCEMQKNTREKERGRSVVIVVS